MDALLTLNLFMLHLPAALLGAGLFGGLILLPPWLTRGPRARHGAAPAAPRPDAAIAGSPPWD